MPGHRYTQAEYALRRVVELFGNLLLSLQVLNLTHTYRVVFSFRATREYRLPGVAVFEHRLITIRGVFRGPVVRRGSVIYIYRGDGL